MTLPPPNDIIITAIFPLVDELILNNAVNCELDD